MSGLHEALGALVCGRALGEAEALAAFDELFDPATPAALAAGFLVALRMRGETAVELSAGVRAMMARARIVEVGGELLDTCGTGGDGAGTFNISTGAGLVAAASGVRVAKHGNRAASGRIGAADLLELLGVKIDLDPDGLRRCLVAAGFCFVFAPAYHPELVRLAHIRRALSVPTIFNLLGPLCNPTRPSRHLLGVADSRMMRPMAETQAAQKLKHAWVLHSEDGFDEISAFAPTRVIEVRDGAITGELRIEPREFGIAPADPAAVKAAITVNGADDAVRKLRGALSGERGPAFDMLAINGGAAIHVGGGAKSLADGVARAREILLSGRALETIERLRSASQEASA
jgi:anthranilate phosphoribosyltransferase